MFENKAVLTNKNGLVVRENEPLPEVTRDGENVYPYFRQLERSENSWTINAYYTKDSEEIGFTYALPLGYRIFETADPEFMLGEITVLHAEVCRLQRIYNDVSETLENARNQIKEDLAGHTNPEEYIEQCEDVMDILGVPTTKQVNVTVTATYEGTITIKYGEDISEYDGDGLDLPGWIEDDGVDLRWTDVEISENGRRW